jgi:hypothetical protein
VKLIADAQSILCIGGGARLCRRFLLLGGGGAMTHEASRHERHDQKKESLAQTASKRSRQAQADFIVAIALTIDMRVALAEGVIDPACR